MCSFTALSQRRIVRSLGSTLMPVGWDEINRSWQGQEPRKRAGRRALTQKDAGPVVAGPAQEFRLN